MESQNSERSGAASPVCLGKEGTDAELKLSSENKKVSPRETENQRGIIIIEEPIPGCTGPSPHEFLDPFFIPVRGVQK